MCRAAVSFVEEIGMMPMRLREGQPGYILDSLLMPFMTAAAKLYVRDVAGLEDIDAMWRKGTGAALGPFEIYDFAGL